MWRTELFRTQSREVYIRVDESRVDLVWWVGLIPCCCSFTPAHSRLRRSQPLYKPPAVYNLLKCWLSLPRSNYCVEHLRAEQENRTGCVASAEEGRGGAPWPDESLLNLSMTNMTGPLTRRPLMLLSKHERERSKRPESAVICPRVQWRPDKDVRGAPGIRGLSAWPPDSSCSVSLTAVAALTSARVGT